MTKSDFKKFRELVDVADYFDTIWSMGFLWVDLTNAQIDKLIPIMANKDCCKTTFQKVDGKTQIHVTMPSGLEVFTNIENLM